MRIRRQTLAAREFPAEIEQIFLRQPAFNEGSRIHPGSRMSLKVNHVARMIWRPGMEEVVKANFH